MILIGSYGCEFSLWENERAKVFCLRGVLGSLVDVDNVETRLVAMHGIQYDLYRWKMVEACKKNKYNNRRKRESCDALAS